MNAQTGSQRDGKCTLLALVLCKRNTRASRARGRSRPASSSPIRRRGRLPRAAFWGRPRQDDLFTPYSGAFAACWQPSGCELASATWDSACDAADANIRSNVDESRNADSGY
jgi:hypothetical protein